MTQSYATEKLKTLDNYLDDRIAANIKYREDFVEEAKESPVAKDLIPVEKKLGDEWVEFIKYVHESKDEKLKIHSLRIEFLDEIRGCYYDLEIAEGFLEKLKIKGEIAKWNKALSDVTKLGEEFFP